MKVKIFVKDRRNKSELRKLSEPEWKFNLEREVMNGNSHIKPCKVLPSGDFQLFTMDKRENALLARSRGWNLARSAKELWPGVFDANALIFFGEYVTRWHDLCYVCRHHI